jgi:hypothetical protein
MYAYVLNNPIHSIDNHGDTIINAASKGSIEFQSTANALKIMQITNPEVYNQLQASTFNIPIQYEDNMQLNGIPLNGRTDVEYSSNCQVCDITTDNKGNVMDGTMSRRLNFQEQEAVRETGGNPIGMTIPVTAAEEQSVKVTSAGIALNRSLLKDPKLLAATLGHEMGHTSFALSSPAKALLWSLIGNPTDVGHGANNPNGQKATAEQKKSEAGYKEALKQIKKNEKNQ